MQLVMVYITPLPVAGGSSLISRSDKNQSSNYIHLGINPLVYYPPLGGALGPIERDIQTRLCLIGALSVVRCLIDLS